MLHSPSLMKIKAKTQKVLLVPCTVCGEAYQCAERVIEIHSD